MTTSLVGRILAAASRSSVDCLFLSSPQVEECFDTYLWMLDNVIAVHDPSERSHEGHPDDLKLICCVQWLSHFPLSYLSHAFLETYWQ